MINQPYVQYRLILSQWAIPGKVTYDISLIYGYNVGMKISSADTSCDAYACHIPSGCVSIESIYMSKYILIYIHMTSPFLDLRGLPTSPASALAAHLQLLALVALSPLEEEGA